MVSPTTRTAFSTLGCPGATLDQVLDYARRGGCTGVELRCREGELIGPGSGLSDARELGDALREGGLSPLCLASYIQIGSPDASVPRQIERHLEIAQAIGAPFVRVFGGDPDDAEVFERAVRRLRDAVDASAETDVDILLETHDAFLSGEAVARVLDESGNPTAGAIWDVVNPWRAGEAPAQTLQHLAHRLRHVQVKDAAAPDVLDPVLPGDGAVPLHDILERLANADYSGWIALEWEAAWYPDAPPLEHALDAFKALVSGLRRPVSPA